MIRNLFSKKLPIILQSESVECGLACINMVAHYYGYKIDLTTLRQNFSTSIKGTSLKDLIDTAEKLKLNARPVKSDLTSLGKIRLPCILHWDMNHFVVLKEVSKKSAIVHDPSVGRRKLSLEELSEHFTGVALELYPNDQFIEKDVEQNTRISEIWRTISGVKRYMVELLVVSICLQLFLLVTPLFLQLVIDEVLIEYDYHLLITLSIAFFLVAIFKVTANTLRNLVVLFLGNQINLQIASNIFNHLIRLPLDYFEKRHIGDVVSRFNSIDYVKQMLTTGFIESFVDGIMAITTLTMMFIYSPFLALIGLLSFSLILIIRLLVIPVHKNLANESIIKNAQESTIFMESVRTIQCLKLFAKENQRSALWFNRYTDAMNAEINVGKLKIYYKTLDDLIISIESLLIILIGASLVIDEKLSLGMLVTFITFKAMFISKATALVEKLIEFKTLEVHLNRMGDIVRTKKEELIDDHGYTDLSFKSGIEVKDLSFRYAKSEDHIFKGINLRVSPGESIVITGPSGCGKTTFLKVLLSLFSEYEGKILVGKSTLSPGNTLEYRRNVASVMQDDTLFSGSISENISLFDTKPDIEKIHSSAKIAQIHNDIDNMPMGYNTHVGDMGSALSGGQRQRLLIARALYGNPKILFMDEATSHLDSELEHKVNNSIKDLSIIRIMVAHRKETIASADKVFKLEKEAIVQVR